MRASQVAELAQGLAAPGIQPARRRRQRDGGVEVRQAAAAVGAVEARAAEEGADPGAARGEGHGAGERAHGLALAVERRLAQQLAALRELPGRRQARERVKASQGPGDVALLDQAVQGGVGAARGVGILGHGLVEAARAHQPPHAVAGLLDLAAEVFRRERRRDEAGSDAGERGEIAQLAIGVGGLASRHGPAEQRPGAGGV